MSATQALVRVRVRRGASLPARLAATLSLWFVGGLLFGICAAVTIPHLFGFRSLVVLSGSMTPTLRVGDVVIVRQIPPGEARVGDVVTFRDPTRGDRLVTHRVRSIEVEAGVVRIQTKGDANSGVESWQVQATGTIGRAGFRVPKIGYALFWIRGRFGRMMLVVFPALLLGAYELWRIWRPRSRSETTDAA
jgi:signal peptidase